MHVKGTPPVTFAEAMRYRVNRTGLDAMVRAPRTLGLGAAFPNYSGPRAGFGVTDTGTSTKNASKYSGTACPAGMQLVSSGRSPRPPKFVGDVSYDEYVYCRPIVAPVAAPAAAPSFNPTITVSPNIQTAISPQISPVFEQMQASPGATQGATTTQQSPNPQTAAPGASVAPAAPDNSSAILDFLKAQSAQAAQAEADRAARQAAIDAANAKMQADYQAALQAQAQPAPSTIVASSLAPASAAPVETQTVAPTAPPLRSIPWYWIVGGVIVVGGGLYLLARKKRR